MNEQARNIRPERDFSLDGITGVVETTIAKHKVVYPVGGDNGSVVFAVAGTTTPASISRPLYLTMYAANASTPEDKAVIVRRAALASGLDTSGASEGDLVYLGASGAPTLTPPTTTPVVPIGVVTSVSADTTTLTWWFDPAGYGAAAVGSKPTVSAETAATGSAQNVAHRLGAIPSLVLVVITEGHDGAGSAGIQVPDIAEGTHTTTNVVLTVTAGAKFKVAAWL